MKYHLPTWQGGWKKRYFRRLPQILPQDAFAGCTVLTIAHRFVCMNNQISTITGFKRRIINNSQTIYLHSPLHHCKNVGVPTVVHTPLIKRQSLNPENFINRYQWIQICQIKVGHCDGLWPSARSRPRQTCGTRCKYFLPNIPNIQNIPDRGRLVG